MKTFEILLAHTNNPEEFKHQMSVQLAGEDAHLFVEEMCEILTEANFYDCIYKVKPEEEPSVMKEALTTFMRTIGGQE